MSYLLEKIQQAVVPAVSPVLKKYSELSIRIKKAAAISLRFLDDLVFNNAIRPDAARFLFSVVLLSGNDVDKMCQKFPLFNTLRIINLFGDGFGIIPLYKSLFSENKDKKTTEDIVTNIFKKISQISLLIGCTTFSLVYFHNIEILNLPKACEYIGKIPLFGPLGALYSGKKPVDIIDNISLFSISIYYLAKFVLSARKIRKTETISPSYIGKGLTNLFKGAYFSAIYTGRIPPQMIGGIGVMAFATSVVTKVSINFSSYLSGK